MTYRFISLLLWRVSNRTVDGIIAAIGQHVKKEKAMRHLGFLDMDDLVKRFAETVAEGTRNWARGEKMK